MVIYVIYINLPDTERGYYFQPCSQSTEQYLAHSNSVTTQYIINRSLSEIGITVLAVFSRSVSIVILTGSLVSLGRGEIKQFYTVAETDHKIIQPCGFQPVCHRLSSVS